MVFLIRHGQVEWNAKNSYIGSTDLPLDHIGFKQADLLAQYLATREIAKVYSSDLLRARQTA
ncbi:MAG: histidine phosphatase family protein, partial [Armatimonadota bacterium]